jgi:4-azaleucine resistance transporter AzlC
MPDRAGGALCGIRPGVGSPDAAFGRTVAAIAVAVAAFGISFGVLARATGLSELQTLAMSAVVFAGSAQFAAIAALDGGASAVSAALSGIALNLRYLPMGLVVAPWLRGRMLGRAAKGQLVVDEAVAVASEADGSVDERRFVATGATLFAAWVGGTAAGALGGGFVGDPDDLGLDAAFPALFLALIAPRLREDAGARRAAAAGALLAAVGVVVLPAGLATVLAAAGAAFGLRATRAAP